MREVWLATRALLEAQALDDCPACFRPYAAPTTRKATLERITTSLDRLDELADAESRLDSADLQARRAAQTLRDLLVRIGHSTSSLQEPAVKAVQSAMSKCAADVEAWIDGSSRAFDVDAESAAITALAAKADRHCRARADALDEQPTEWSEMLTTARSLRNLAARMLELDTEENELIRVQEQYKAVAAFVKRKIQDHVGAIVKGLNADVQAIYRDLRGADSHIPQVKVEVADDKKTMRVAIKLFGKESVPSGYLSDSQMNSLGLALFIAAIRKFNDDLRLVVLDDIMSSYDASHRLNLVNVLRKYLCDHQVVLTTHDQAFFREIKSVLNGTGNWSFDRLGPWSLERGVLIARDCSPDEEIDKRIAAGELPLVVAGLVMEAFETWLYDLCAAQKVAKFRINKDRSGAEPLTSDLWAAAQSLLSEMDKAHPSYGVVSGHGLLNWSRHSATAPLGLTTSEIGAFWQHFKAFRQDFKGAPAVK